MLHIIARGWVSVLASNHKRYTLNVCLLGIGLATNTIFEYIYFYLIITDYYGVLLSCWYSLFIVTFKESIINLIAFR